MKRSHRVRVFAPMASVVLAIAAVSQAVEGQDGDSLRQVTSPGSNTVMILPKSWRFITSAELKQDSSNELATLVGTIVSPDSATTVYVERMNRVYPSELLAKRIRDLGLERHCESIVDSVTGVNWRIAEFIHRPSWMQSTVEYGFTARLSMAPDGGTTAGEEVVFRYLYRHVSGVDIRIHSFSKPTSYAAVHQELDSIFLGARPTVAEAEVPVEAAESTRVTGGERHNAVAIVVAVLALAVLTGVVAWKALSRRRRR